MQTASIPVLLADVFTPATSWKADMTTTEARSSQQHDVLTDEQLGHLRHIDNLSRQLPNDWSMMQGKDGSQDDFGGYRFQLSYMTYAMALAHRHRLPNAPGVFKPVFERMIEKMLLPEVWMYWRNTSRGGAILNAHLSQGYSEEWNPVVKDNIMYSAYVQSMSLMYDYLFDDARYSAPGALSFDHWSFFWGGEGHRFEYDQNSLNEHIYWQMVESGYIGVACEPNCVFQICNQPAILGFRMHDLLTGGNTAEEVTRSYDKVWSELGRLDASGHYTMMLVEDAKIVVPAAEPTPWVDAWAGSLMNMWKRDFVHARYPEQIQDLLVRGTDGALSVRPSAPLSAMGRVGNYDSGDFGWTTVWASEMGDQETLRGLLTHADRYMNPTWKDGGLYYPRNDTPTDADGNSTVVEPITGNALLAYARLNVPDGLWALYNEPWDASHHTEPSLVEVSGDVAVSQARFDRESNCLNFRVQRHGDRQGDGRVMISNVPDDTTWTMRENGTAIASGGSTSSARTSASIRVVGNDEGLSFQLPVGGPLTLQLELGAS